MNLAPSLPFAVLALADAPRWQTADAAVGMQFAFASAQLARSAATLGVPVALWLRAHDLTVRAWEQWLDRLRFLADVGMPVILSAPVIGSDLQLELRPLLARAPHLLGFQVPESQRARWPLGQVGPLGIGFACHDAAGLGAARAAGAAWATVSPVWPTPRKPDAAALGPAVLQTLVQASGVPVVALGGVGASQVAAVFAAGAAAVAADSALWHNPQGFLAAVAAARSNVQQPRQGS